MMSRDSVGRFDDADTIAALSIAPTERTLVEDAQHDIAELPEGTGVTENMGRGTVWVRLTESMDSGKPRLQIKMLIEPVNGLLSEIVNDGTHLPRKEALWSLLTECRFFADAEYGKGPNGLQRAERALRSQFQKGSIPPPTEDWPLRVYENDATDANQPDLTDLVDRSVEFDITYGVKLPWMAAELRPNNPGRLCLITSKNTRDGPANVYMGKISRDRSEVTLLEYTKLLKSDLMDPFKRSRPVSGSFEERQKRQRTAFESEVSRINQAMTRVNQKPVNVEIYNDLDMVNTLSDMLDYMARNNSAESSLQATEMVAPPPAPPSFTDRLVSGTRDILLGRARRN